MNKSLIKLIFIGLIIGLLSSCGTTSSIVDKETQIKQQKEIENIKNDKEIFIETYEIDMSNLPKEIEEKHLEPEACYRIPIINKKFLKGIIFSTKIFCPIDELVELRGNTFDIVFNSKYSNFKVSLKMYKINDEKQGIINPPKLIIDKKLKYIGKKKLKKTDRIIMTWQGNKLEFSTWFDIDYIEISKEDLFGEFNIEMEINFPNQRVKEKVVIKGIKTSSKPIDDEAHKALIHFIKIKKESYLEMEKQKRDRKNK